jgi:hypothetical protein
MRKSICVSLCVLIIAHPTMTYGWHNAGHVLVAGVAWERISSNAPLKQRVERILATHKDYASLFSNGVPPDLDADRDRGLWDLAFASTWPDYIRQTPDDRPTWHYYNKPLAIDDGTRQNMQKAIEKLKINVALDWSPSTDLAESDKDGLTCVQAIKRARAVLRSKSASDAEKAIAICWLAHLVGDLHQPLHTTTLIRTTDRGFMKDNGGNYVVLQQGDPGGNMHHYWDGLYDPKPDQSWEKKTPYGDYPRMSLVKRELARLMTIQNDPSTKRDLDADAVDLDPADWVDEGFELAATVAFPRAMRRELRGQSPSSRVFGTAPRLDAAYHNAAKDVADQRIVLAGIRLARMLEEDLKANDQE